MRIGEGIDRVLRIDVRVADFDWVFAREQAARIDAHWSEQCRRRPALYDGRVLLAHDVRLEGDAVRGACFETGFKSFLSWRDFGFPDPSVRNFFAMAALRSADGAFMLGEMSPTTSNGGRLYFPSGTPEPADVTPEGIVDLEGSALRELEEETGLPREDLEVADFWIVVRQGASVACMKLVQSHLSAAALQGRLAAFNAGLADPELVGLVPVRSRADYDPARMPAFMLRYLDAALAA